MNTKVPLRRDVRFTAKQGRPASPPWSFYREIEVNRVQKNERFSKAGRYTLGMWTLKLNKILQSDSLRSPLNIIRYLES